MGVQRARERAQGLEGLLIGRLIVTPDARWEAAGAEMASEVSRDA